MSEAAVLQYPLRLLWVLLEFYGQPRVIKACGCWGLPTRAQQGILAGCARDDADAPSRFQSSC
eukprot:817383-Pyramimonas_sp.AAC.1